MKILRPSRQYYEIVSQSSTTLNRHFKQYHSSIEVPLIPEYIHFSEDRGYSNASGVTDWLKWKNNDSDAWSHPITGLRRIGVPNTYYGNIAEVKNGKLTPQHLILFRFKKDSSRVVLQVYSDYYPKNKKTILNLSQTLPTEQINPVSTLQLQKQVSDG